MRVSLIVAVAENGVIGRAGGLPWRLSADLVRFKQLTLGHHLIMGRKTFESIGRVLPGRTSLVVSRNAAFALPVGCLLVPSLDEALALAEAAGETEAFVIGGADIFALAMPRADRIYLTTVHAAVEGDTYLSGFAAGQGSPLAPREEALHLAERDDYIGSGDGTRSVPATLSGWTLLQDERRPADAKNEYEFSFRVLERSSSSPAR